MKRFIQKLALVGTALCLCMTMLVPSAFAAETTKYVLSFRPGAYGTFSDGAVSYLSQYGEAQKSGTGNLYLQVEAGAALPADLESSLRQYLVAEDGYYYRSGLNAGATATEDATFVADYGVLSGGGVAYTVRYVDAASGTELAESYTGYANAGDTITYQAKALDGYTVDQASKSITIAKNVDMTIEFRYTAVTVPGETIENVTTVTVPATITTAGTGTGTGTGTDTAAGTGAGTETPADTQQPADGETIPDADTPLTPGNDADQSGEAIPDESTPTVDTIPGSDSSSSSSGNVVATVTVVGVCAALVIAAVIYFLLRRKG